MSASNSQQILDKAEPLGGVKHVKPPIKPKPVVLPRPKEIPGSENKSPLLSPTCGPPLDIPSALKISQLTGPQPYGTRRASLKRWLSSAGEEGNQENKSLSPIENKSTDLPAKSTAQPLSAAVRPVQTGAAWKGKSPFMLTTRGWGEQRLTQSRDYNESEAASQKPTSSLVSKATVPQRRETTTVEENKLFNLKSPSRITPEEKAVIPTIEEAITSPEKLPSRLSEGEKICSSVSGSSNRPEEIKECQKQLSVPRPSDLQVESSKQVSQYEHEESVMVQSSGSRIENKAPSVPVRKSLHVPKSQTEVENVKNAVTYNNQVPVEGSGHVFLHDDISVDQEHLENTDKNRQPGAYVDLHGIQQVGDVVHKKYTQHTSTAYEQPSDHHDNQQPKDKYITSELSPPKPKERKKPSVQFNVPKADDQAERPILDYRPAELEQKEGKEHEHAEDGDAEGRHGEDGMKEKPSSYGQQKTAEGKREMSSKIDEAPGFVKTQTTNYTVTTDNEISREDVINEAPTDYTVTTDEIYRVDVINPPTSYTLSHRSERHDSPIQENVNGQPEVHGSSVHHKEIKDHDELQSISPTTKLYEDVEHGNQDIVNKELDDDVEEEHRIFHKERGDADSDVKNVEYMPHFSPIPIESSPAPRSQHGNNISSPCDARTSYTCPSESSTADHSENTDRKEALVEIEAQSEDKLPPQKIYTHSKEFDASSAQVQPQEEMTELKNYSVRSSKPNLGGLEESESSKSKEFHLSHSKDPICKDTQSTALSDKRDDKDGIQYYNIYSQNVQDEEELEHGVDEAEDLHYPGSPLEEPLHKFAQSREVIHSYALSEEAIHPYAQSEKPVHPYAQSEKPVHSYVQSEKSVHPYAQSEKPVHPYVQSEEPVHPYVQSEEPVHPYVQSEEPDDPYAQSEEEKHMYSVLKKAQHAYYNPEHLSDAHKESEESVQHNIQSEEESHGYAVLKKAKYECYQPEKLDRTYDPSNKLISHNDQSKQLDHRHKPSMTSTLTSEQSEKQDNTYDQFLVSYPQDAQPKELEKVREHAEETFVKYSQPHDPDKIISLVNQSDELHYPQTEVEEPISRNYLLTPSEKTICQNEQSEEQNYLQAQSDEPHYKLVHTEGSHYLQPQSKGSNDKPPQSENLDYQHTQSKESYYQQEDSEEPNYQQAEESEELHIRYKQPENLEYKDNRSEESHLISYSEQSQQEDVQTPEGKIKVSGENKGRLIEPSEHEYMDLHATETDSGHVTLAEQNKAESRPETYLQQQHRGSPPGQYHHKDDSISETYHKELPSKEQEMRDAQEEETLDMHIVEPDRRDVLQERQEHTDFKVTNKHSQSHESRTDDLQDISADDRLDKNTYIEKHINGHSEMKELEYREDKSDGQKLSDEVHKESPGESASDTEETPEVNFDFLEGTSVLDTSLMRGRASLGKKRCHRTPATATCTSQEETDHEYWMFRDSTEPKCSSGKDSDGEEKEETSPDCSPGDSPSSVKSPTKKGGIFSGIRPSILKGRLKSRSKTSEYDVTKTEAKEIQEPTSPGKDKSDKDKSESSSHSLNWLQALKKKKKKQPK